MSIYKTPLRYPGGKQKIWQFIAEVLAVNGLEAGHYVEPYGGGAGVAMELLLRKKVQCVHLNDVSLAVFAFWKAVLNDPEKLCRKISRASLTVEEWRRQRDIFKRAKSVDQFDLGFATFYLNRCNHSGILTGGLIGGLAQKGFWKMDARFPRKKLIKRIEAIADYKRAIKIKNWDAETFLIEYASRLPWKTLVYCDPPYIMKADRLYQNHYHHEDHKRIADVIQTKLKLPWLVSYDFAPSILTYYRGRRSFLYNLQYNAAKVYKGSELLIFCDGLALPKRSNVANIDVALNILESTKREASRGLAVC